MSMAETEIEIPAPAGAMRTFIARPEGKGTAPLAIMCQDGPGYRDALKDVARRFAAAGFCCVLPDWTYRFGKPVEIADDHEKASSELTRRIREILANPDETLGEDTKALLAYVEAEGLADAGRVVTVGYCWGAAAVVHLMAAFPARFVAGSGWHPFWLGPDGAVLPMHLEGAPEPPEGAEFVPRKILDDLGRARGELLFGVPASDRWINQASFALLAREMAARGARGVLEVHPGTEHGFTIPGSPLYDEAASERHFDQTIALWRSNLGRPANDFREELG